MLVAIAAITRNWTDAGLAFVYPETCQVCHEARATPREAYVCHRCRAQIKFVEPPFCARCGRPVSGDVTGDFQCGRCEDERLNFSFARSAAFARSTVLEAIHSFKYKSGLWLEPFLAELLVSRARPQLANAGWDVVVPVPLFPTKQRERGFNQSARLARHLAKALALPCAEKVVRRVLPTRTQTRLTRTERLENVRRAFLAVSRQEVRGRRVILVDDVFTTGATTNACAGALVHAGAAEVCVWTLARGI